MKWLILIIYPSNATVQLTADTVAGIVSGVLAEQVKGEQVNKGDWWMVENTGSRIVKAIIQSNNI